MKRFPWMPALILFVCTVLFFTVSLPFTADGPEAEAGVLDFREADFEKNAYTLDGQWEFYYGCLYTPEDFLKGKPAGGELAAVPGSWTELGYPMSGYGTYRLTVRTGSSRPLLLHIPEIMSSSAVWVNGEPMFQAGRAGTSAAETVPGVRNELLIVVPRDGVLELVVQAANFHMFNSGLYYSFTIGRDTVLLHHIFWQRIMAAAALGGILLMGIYHLFLYGFRGREKLYLTFSLTCMTAVLRLTMETNNLVQYFCPGGLSMLLSRLYLLSFVLHSLCICSFMLQVFSILLGRRMRRLYLVSFLLPIAVISWPQTTLDIAIGCMFLVLLPYAFSVVRAVSSGKIGRDPYRLLYFFSLITFMLYGPFTKTVLESELFVPAVVPNMFLILAQCVMLSRDYAKARSEVERINENLEQLVEQRTEELHDANRQLEDINGQLTASQTALREMISSISHDLKTPLTVLNNYLELLGDGTVTASEQERAEYLAIAYHKNLDLQRLIRNLFEATRMEGGMAVYRLEKIPAALLMSEACQKYAELARDNGLRFSAGAEKDVELEVDRNKIWSILDNLVYNAIRHTPRGGSITVIIRKNGDGAELQVEDTGEGIAPEHLPHIFERFYKVSPERGEKDGSSGLGLYIVKTAVEAMGGTVSAESVIGRGTVFTIQFPRVPH